MVADDDLHMHLDPGPGAFIYSVWSKLSPRNLGAIMISHCHLDHYADAEVMIEAMTRGMTKKRGVLIGSRSVLYGNEICGPAISRYHQSMPKAVVISIPDKRFPIGDLEVSITKAEHADPDSVGFLIETPDVGSVGYTSDTTYFEGIGEYYHGARLLILCTLRPHGAPWKGHMSTDDAIKIIQESKPDAAVITHFGMKMIMADPELEADLIQKKTRVPTIDAKDGAWVEVGESIEFCYKKTRTTIV